MCNSSSVVSNFSLLIFVGIFRFLLTSHALILFTVGDIFPFIFVGILVILLSRALFILAVAKFKQLVFVRILIFLLAVPAWTSLPAQVFFTRLSGSFHSFLAVSCSSWLLTDSGSLSSSASSSLFLALPSWYSLSVLSARFRHHPHLACRPCPQGCVQPMCCLSS